MTESNTGPKCELLNTYEVLEHVMGMTGLHPHCSTSIDNLRKRLAQHINTRVTSSDGVVIDIGCGSGAGTAELARLLPANRVIGLDIKKNAVASAARDHASITNLAFFHGNLDDFVKENPDTGIVGVICVSVSMFIHDLEAFYEKIFNVLDHQGIFIDAPFTFRDDLDIPNKGFRLATYAMCGCNMQMFKISQLNEKISKAGFSTVESIENGFDLMNMSVLFKDYSAKYLFANFFRNILSPPADIKNSSSWYILQRTIKIFYFFFRNRNKYGSGELVAIKS